MKPLLLSLALLFGLASTAHAGDSCRALSTGKHASLSQRARERFPDGASWERTRKWQVISVSVYLTRSPEIAREILHECGAVVDQASASDPRRLSSQLQIHVTSWAVLARIAQLPAVTYVAAIDTSIKIKRPPHRRPADFPFD